MQDCFYINEVQAKRLMYGITTNNDDLNTSIRTLRQGSVQDIIETLKKCIKKQNIHSSHEIETMMKYILIYDKTKIDKSVVIPEYGLPWHGTGNENNTCWLVSGLAVMSSMKRLLDVLSTSKNDDCKFLFDILAKYHLKLNTNIKHDFIERFYKDYLGQGGGTIFYYLKNNVFDDEVNKTLFYVNHANKCIIQGDMNNLYNVLNINQLPEYITIQTTVPFNKRVYKKEYNHCIYENGKPKLVKDEFETKLDINKMFVKCSSKYEQYNLFAIIVGTTFHYYPIFFEDSCYETYYKIDGSNKMKYVNDLFDSCLDCILCFYCRTNQRIDFQLIDPNI